jgi:hypothetical protein
MKLVNNFLEIKEIILILIFLTNLKDNIEKLIRVAGESPIDSATLNNVFKANSDVEALKYINDYSKTTNNKGAKNNNNNNNNKGGNKKAEAEKSKGKQNENQKMKEKEATKGANNHCKGCQCENNQSSTCSIL